MTRLASAVFRSVRDEILSLAFTFEATFRGNRPPTRFDLRDTAMQTAIMPNSDPCAD